MKPFKRRIVVVTVQGSNKIECRGGFISDPFTEFKEEVLFEWITIDPHDEVAIYSQRGKAYLRLNALGEEEVVELKARLPSGKEVLLVTICRCASRLREIKDAGLEEFALEMLAILKEKSGFWSPFLQMSEGTSRLKRLVKDGMPLEAAFLIVANDFSVRNAKALRRKYPDLTPDELVECLKPTHLPSGLSSDDVARAYMAKKRRPAKKVGKKK